MSAGFAAKARKSEQHGEKPRKDCGCHKGVESEAGVPRFLKGRVQPKLRVGRADDPLEREADRVAEQVVRRDPVTPMSSVAAQAHRKRAGQPLHSATHAFFQARFEHDFSRARVIPQPAPLMRQTPDPRGSAGALQAPRTHASVVSAQRLLTSGKGETGNKLGPVDLLTYMTNGVELQFDINKKAAEAYHNLRPRQWAGTESIWLKAGHPLRGTWRLSHASRGTGKDDPGRDLVAARPSRIAFYDSPGPSVLGYAKSRPSRVHVVQNFTSWIEGDPVSGGPAKRLNKVLAWNSIVSLVDEGWPDKTQKWVRLYPSGAGTGWSNTKKRPPI